MLKNKKILIAGASLAALFFLIYGIIRVASRPLELPPEFLSARQEASRLSQEIVEVTSKTNSLIKEINVSELSGQTGVALRLIKEANSTNEIAYEKAFELSVAVQRLAETINQIDSARGRQLAYEATSFELALISNFISYTQSLKKFLDNLALAVQTNNREYRQQVTDSLAEVNQQIFNINNLNRDFLARMSQLDSL